MSNTELIISILGGGTCLTAFVTGIMKLLQMRRERRYQIAVNKENKELEEKKKENEDYIKHIFTEQIQTIQKDNDKHFQDVQKSLERNNDDIKANKSSSDQFHTEVLRRLNEEDKKINKLGDRLESFIEEQNLHNTLSITSDLNLVDVLHDKKVINGDSVKLKEAIYAGLDEIKKKENKMEKRRYNG